MWWITTRRDFYDCSRLPQKTTSCRRGWCGLRVFSCHASEAGFVILVMMMMVVVIMMWDAGLGSVCAGKNDGDARKTVGKGTSRVCVCCVCACVVRTRARFCLCAWEDGCSCLDRNGSHPYIIIQWADFNNNNNKCVFWCDSATAAVNHVIYWINNTSWWLILLHVFIWSPVNHRSANQSSDPQRAVWTHQTGSCCSQQMSTNLAFRSKSWHKWSDC